MLRHLTTNATHLATTNRSTVTLEIILAIPSRVVEHIVGYCAHTVQIPRVFGFSLISITLVVCSDHCHSLRSEKTYQK